MELATHFCEFNYPSTCQAFILSTCQPFVLSFYLAIHLPLPLFPCKLHGTWNSCGWIQLSTYLSIYLPSYLPIYLLLFPLQTPWNLELIWLNRSISTVSIYLSIYLSSYPPTYLYLYSPCKLCGTWNSFGWISLWSALSRSRPNLGPGSHLYATLLQDSPQILFN